MIPIKKQMLDVEKSNFRSTFDVVNQDFQSTLNNNLLTNQNSFFSKSKLVNEVCSVNNDQKKSKYPTDLYKILDLKNKIRKIKIMKRVNPNTDPSLKLNVLSYRKDK
jgi:hypothetical protein